MNSRSEEELSINTGSSSQAEGLSDIVFEYEQWSDDHAFEVPVESFESARNAYVGGANIVQLYRKADVGRVTPSAGQIIDARSIGQKPIIFAYIRPKNRTYQYSLDERLSIAEDFGRMRRHGAEGFVFAALTESKQVDLECCNFLMRAVEGLPATFDTAFDLLHDKRQGLNKIIQLGFRRVLTKVETKEPETNLGKIKQYIDQADDRIVVVPTGGIDVNNLENILETTGAREFNCSAKVRKVIKGHSDPALDRNRQEKHTRSSDYVCSSEKVQELLNIAKRVWHC